jgi:hypothetical protein
MLSDPRQLPMHVGGIRIQIEWRYMLKWWQAVFGVLSTAPATRGPRHFKLSCAKLLTGTTGGTACKGTAYEGAAQLGKPARVDPTEG